MAITQALIRKNTTDLKKDNLNGHIVKLKMEAENVFAIADSGSPMLF